MNHIQRGSGRKLLLVHGLGGSWHSWSTAFDALGAHRTVIAVDLPGHGARHCQTNQHLVRPAYFWPRTAKAGFSYARTKTDQ